MTRKTGHLNVVKFCQLGSICRASSLVHMLKCLRERYWSLMNPLECECVRESYNVLGCLSAQLRAVKHCTSAEHVLLFFTWLLQGQWRVAQWLSTLFYCSIRSPVFFPQYMSSSILLCTSSMQGYENLMSKYILYSALLLYLSTRVEM